jgi:Trk K+ transport system NAD-binding subunit
MTIITTMTTDPTLLKLARIENECMALAAKADGIAASMLSTAAACLRVSYHHVAKVTDPARRQALLEKAVEPAVRALGIAARSGGLSGEAALIPMRIASELCSET